MTARPHAVVFGLGATGLAVARALGRRGYSVLGVDPRPWEVGRASRYVRAAVTTVDRLLAEWRLGTTPHATERAVGFVAGDPELVAVSQLAEALAPWLVLPRSIRDGTAAALVHKGTLYQRAAGAGAPVLPWAVDGVAGTGSGPWVAKPALAGAAADRPFPEKARLVRSAAEIARFRDVIVQAHVDGPVSQIAVWAGTVDEEGRVGAHMTGQKEREVPRPFGSASWLVTTHDPEVDAASRALVAALGLDGLVGVEWKRDRAGQLWLIEVNARPVLWLGVAEALIVDCFQSLRGAPRPPPVAEPAGHTWRYWSRDPTAPVAAVDALWAPDDPLPGLLGPAYTAVLAGQRLLGRRF